MGDDGERADVGAGWSWYGEVDGGDLPGSGDDPRVARGGCRRAAGVVHDVHERARHVLSPAAPFAARR